MSSVCLPLPGYPRRTPPLTLNSRAALCVATTISMRSHDLISQTRYVRDVRHGSDIDGAIKGIP